MNKQHTVVAAGSFKTEKLLAIDFYEMDVDSGLTAYHFVETWNSILTGSYLMSNGVVADNINGEF